MKLIRFRIAASADMRGVMRDTRARWDNEQAARYTAQLRADIKSLRDLPLRFPKVEERPGLRRMNSGRHAVFYLVLKDRIEIVRVLHQSMDFSHRLE